MRRHFLPLLAALGLACAPATAGAQTQPAADEFTIQLLRQNNSFGDIQLFPEQPPASVAALATDSKWHVVWVVPRVTDRTLNNFRWPPTRGVTEPTPVFQADETLYVAIVSPVGAALQANEVTAGSKWLQNVAQPDPAKPRDDGRPRPLRAKWADLQLRWPEPLRATAVSRFEYHPDRFRYPFIVACPRGCDAARMDEARAWLLANPAAKPPPSAAPGPTAGVSPSPPGALPGAGPITTPGIGAPKGPTNVPLPPQPAPTGPITKTPDPPPKPPQVRVWIIDHATGRPSATKGIDVAAAATCRELQVRPPRKPLVQGEPIALPTGLTADSVCVGVWAPRQIDGACLMTELRHGLLVLPEYLLEHGAKVQPCVPLKARFTVRYRSAPYAGEVSDWRELSPQDGRAMGERVRIDGTPARDSIELPIDIVDLTQAGMQRVDISRFAITIAPPATHAAIYVWARPSPQKTPPHELTVDLHERFVKLGRLKFEPRNSHDEFEEGCEPRLQIRTQPTDRAEWNTLRQRNPALFDGEAIKLYVNRDDKSYRVNPALANVAIDLGATEGDAIAAIVFPRNTACKAAEPIMLSPRAVAGREPDAMRPVVRRVGPPFFVIVNHSQHSAQQVGLSPSLSIDFWGQVATMGQGILAAGNPAYERKAIGMWNESRILQLDDSLLGNRGRPADLPNDIHKRAPGLTGHTAFDFQVNLEDAIRAMAVGRQTDLPRDARILVVGSTLGPRGTACHTLMAEPSKRYAEALKRARARVVFVEVVARAPDQAEVVAGAKLGGLFRCKPLAEWDDIAEAYLLTTDKGVVSGLIEPNFEHLRKQVGDFFARGLE